MDDLIIYELAPTSSHRREAPASMAAEALTELAEGAEAPIGAHEAEVQVPASQWTSEASKRRPLQPISGNRVSKDIRKTKTTEGRKPIKR